MFRRRRKLTIAERVRDFFWPRAGWQRSSRYVFHRVARIPGTPYDLAAGFACGAAVSFTPFVGLHFVLAAILAFVIRANVVAAAIGTVIGNPWTFPFIWIWIYKLGHWMGAGSPDDTPRPDFTELFGHIMDATLSLDLAYLAQTAWPVWWPMLLGSIPTTVAAWIAFYWPLKTLVTTYQDRRIRHRVQWLDDRPPVPPDQHNRPGT